MLVLTKQKLRFSVIESNGERLKWVSQGNNVIETAPEWIRHSKMFLAVNGSQLSVITQETTIAVSKPAKKKAEPKDDESSV